MNIALTVLGFLAFDVALAATVIYVLSRYSGWQSLASHYPLRKPAPEPKTKFGFGVFRGWIGYNGGLIVSSDSDGLYLRTWPYLLAFHPPVFIPWSEIRKIEPWKVWLDSGYRLRLARAPELNFALRETTFALVRDDARRAGVPGAA
jgi:hypothetical protein